jgi:hypothetical protein
MRIVPVRNDTFAALGLLAGETGLSFLNSGVNAALPALKRSFPRINAGLAPPSRPYTGTYWLR